MWRSKDKVNKWKTILYSLSGVYAAAPTNCFFTCASQHTEANSMELCKLSWVRTVLGLSSSLFRDGHHLKSEKTLCSYHWREKRGSSATWSMRMTPDLGITRWIPVPLFEHPAAPFTCLCINENGFNMSPAVIRPTTDYSEQGGDGERRLGQTDEWVSPGWSSMHSSV